MELRRHSRHAIQLSVEFVLKGETERHAARSRDMSIGGMFVETESPPPFGAELWVHVKLPGKGEELALPGVVRWSAPEGIGVQFGLLGARETHAITEALRAV